MIFCNECLNELITSCTDDMGLYYVEQSCSDLQCVTSKDLEVVVCREWNGY